MKSSRPLKPCERKNLIKTAKKAGFSEDGLRYLFVILNIKPQAMTYETYTHVLPYVNRINAEKFNAMV